MLCKFHSFFVSKVENPPCVFLSTITIYSFKFVVFILEACSTKGAEAATKSSAGLATTAVASVCNLRAVAEVCNTTNFFAGIAFFNLAMLPPPIKIA